MQAVIPGESPLRVFVSGPLGDDTRWAHEATYDVLRQPDWIVPWLFEHTPASSETLSDSYLSKVPSSDLVIWLVDNTTTEPVRREIAVAIDADRPILVFRISNPPSNAKTEALVSRVGTKWQRVVDSTDLKDHLRMALADEIVRAWRAAGRSIRAPMLDLLHNQSRSRCIDRWRAAGLSQDIAVTLADDPSVGMLTTQVFGSRNFAILRAEIGAGKSLAAERLFQDALRLARNSTHERLPLFLEAKHIAGPLDRAIVSETGASSVPTGDSFLVIIDGLDEASANKRAPLACAARRLSIEWPAARILITSRPVSEFDLGFDEFFIDVPTLTRSQSLALMTKIAERPICKEEFWDLPESLQEAIGRPLFAILLAIRHRDRHLAATPMGRLLSNLVVTSLGRVNAAYETAFPLLRKLGRLVIDNQGEPVPTADVTTYAEAAPLLRSRLVVERNGTIKFPLMILAEWFAGRDLEVGVPPVNVLVADSVRLGRWRVPLAMCISDTSEANVARILTPLAATRPAVAATALADAYSEWAVAEPASRLPSWQKFGEGFRSAMAAWVRGLGTASQQIAPIHDDGTLRTIGIRMDGTSVTVSWARRRNAQTVVELPDSFLENGFEWLGATTRYRVVYHNGFDWVWTLNELKGTLTTLLEQRRLPTATPIRAEFGWRAVLSLLRRSGSLDSRPIPKKLVAEGLRSYPVHGIYSDAGVCFDVEQVRSAVERLMENQTGEYIVSPWPGPELSSGPYVWSGYSPPALLNRTRAVYSAALEAYCEMVDQWFPNFRHDLQLSSKRPVTLVGMIAPAPSSDLQGRGPGICYYLEPNVSGSPIDVDIRLGDEAEWDRFVGRAADMLGNEIFSYSVSMLRVFLDDAAEDLAYWWLREDLRRVHWTR